MSQHTIEIGNTWTSIAEGKDAVLHWAVKNGLSFQVKKSDKDKWLAICRDPHLCDFRVRIIASIKLQAAKLTVFVPHTCPPSTHYGWRATNSVKVLASNPLSIATIVDNCKMKSR